MMKAMFEPENLANASPATVSRAGIIYVSDTELGFAPVAKSWLQKRREAEAAILEPFFDRYVQHMLDYIRINLKPMMWNERVCQVMQVMDLLDSFLMKTVTSGQMLSAQHYERAFLYCLAWGLGGLLSEKERPLFDAELRTISKEMPDKADEVDTLFDYVVLADSPEWKLWTELVPSWEYPKAQERVKFAQLVVPTLDSVRYEQLLRLSYERHKACLL
eukprot:scaffold188672_cov44-Prasinocladus_malaysianus.AAC.1